ncbi:MAG: bifunctional 5,10-methylenetetrahydrofolate dehydrogenase/5,10-methenyltetrahydrofolate cyclohydrolase [Candidatus Paceibacterota bacterium]|jgi:5,10-methylene-tetrahydrofolate dehydrogenase/methenyl tetrahydrofolate cyclohydrolase
MTSIDGKKIAAAHIADFQIKKQPEKFLAAFCVGENQSSIIFLKQKKRVADILRVEFRLVTFSQNIEESELCREIKKMGEDSMCGGIIVQLPLPSHFNVATMLNTIPYEKDIDVLSDEARRRCKEGINLIYPPAVGACKTIIKEHYGVSDVTNKIVAVVGLGMLVGSPITEWFRGKCKELILIDKGDGYQKIKNVDIVICGTGVPHLIDITMVKQDALIIDFGYGEKNGVVCGDFSPSSIGDKEEDNITYTPTPGGTGPILVAQLFENFFTINS